jgi:RNA polymerase sigma-70 factor (ECF subfamily)
MRCRDRNAPDYRENMEYLCESYWKPTYWYIRALTGSDSELAKDITQEFFTHLMEKEVLVKLEERGSFRGFLKQAIRWFIMNRFRGGERNEKVLSLEILEEGGSKLSLGSDTPEVIYHRQWAIALLQRALQRLREEYADAQHAYFEAFRVSLGRHAAFVRECARRMPENGPDGGAARKILERLRRRFRQHVRAEIRNYLCSDGDRGWTESEIDEEIQSLKQYLARTGASGEKVAK